MEGERYTINMVVILKTLFITFLERNVKPDTQEINVVLQIYVLMMSDREI